MAEEDKDKVQRLREMREMCEGNSDVLEEKPYCYGTHRKYCGTVVLWSCGHSLSKLNHFFHNTTQRIAIIT